MRLQKTITIYIEEEPEKVNAGDLLFQRNQDDSIMNPKKLDEFWSIHRYNDTPTGGYWQALSKFTHQEAIKWQFGIDLEGK